MASRFARANARANRVFMERLTDGLATYQINGGEALLEVSYQLDLDYEAYDQNQVPMRARTVLVPVSRVPASSQGDLIVTESRTYKVQQLLEDDGHWRRLWVS